MFAIPKSDPLDLLLFGIGMRLTQLAKVGDPKFTKLLENRNFTIQMGSDAQDLYRTFSVENGRFTQSNGKTDKPTLSIDFKDSMTGAKLLTKGDATAFMMGVQNGDVKMSGDYSLLMWFNQVAKHIVPKVPEQLQPVVEAAKPFITKATPLAKDLCSKAMSLLSDFGILKGSDKEEDKESSSKYFKEAKKDDTTTDKSSDKKAEDKSADGKSLVETAKEKLTEAKAEVEEKVEALKEKVDDVKDEAKNKFEAVKDKAEDKVDAAKDKAEDLTQETKDKLNDTKAKAEEKVEDIKDKADDLKKDAEEKVTDIKADVKEAVTEKSETLKDKADTLKSDVKDNVAAVKSDVKDTLDTAKDKLTEVKSDTADKADTLKQNATEKLDTALTITKEKADTLNVSNASDTKNSEVKTAELSGVTANSTEAKADFKPNTSGFNTDAQSTTTAKDDAKADLEKAADKTQSKFDELKAKLDNTPATPANLTPAMQQSQVLQSKHADEKVIADNVKTAAVNDDKSPITNITITRADDKKPS